MQRTGRQLGSAIGAGRLTAPIIFLRGDLGAGKTTLVKGLLSGLGVTEAVTSPTFTLVEQYDIGSGSLFHFDLYRLETPEELEMLGFRDMLGTENIAVFEWPERGQGILPVANLDIAIAFAPGQRDGRQNPDWTKFDPQCRIVQASPAISPYLSAGEQISD